jgi:hypothetical protein
MRGDRCQTQVKYIDNYNLLARCDILFNGKIGADGVYFRGFSCQEHLVTDSSLCGQRFILGRAIRRVNQKQLAWEAKSRMHDFSATDMEAIMAS